MTPPGIPVARPIRTAFDIVWERGDRWVIRPATHHVWLANLGIVMIFVAAAVWWRWSDEPVLAVFVIPAALLAGRTLGGRSCLIDWGAGAFVRGIWRFPFAELRGLALESGRRTSYSKGATTSRQDWDLKILSSRGGGGIRICSSTNNLRLLRAARRLANALEVPLYDQSGPNKLVRVWHPKSGSVPLASAIEISAGAAAQIPRPRAPKNAGETPRADGAEIFWNVRGRSPWIAVFVSFALTLLSIDLMVFVHPAWTILLVNLSGPLLVISLVLPREYGRNFVRVTSHHVTLGRPFPFRHTHRARRAAISEIRIVETVFFRKPHGDPTPRREIVQLLDRDARLLCRISVPCGTGIWLALAIQRAL